MSEMRGLNCQFCERDGKKSHARAMTNDCSSAGNNCHFARSLALSASSNLFPRSRPCAPIQTLCVLVECRERKADSATEGRHRQAINTSILQRYILAAQSSFCFLFFPPRSLPLSNSKLCRKLWADISSLTTLNI